MRRKNPKADLRLQYPRVLEVALIISLLLMTTLFLASKEFTIKPRQTRAEEVVIKVEDIPITHQIKRPPPPARPTIPIESDETDIAEDLTIADTEWDISDEPPPPPAKNEEVIDFFAIEEKPEIVGGAQAIYDYIQKNNLFPEMARQAGVGGVTIIQFVVSETGKPTDVEIFQERPPGLGFGEAGVKAIKAMTFKPGKQRDRFVKVRMQQVIRFEVK